MFRTICIILLLVVLVLVVAGLAQAAGEGGWALPRTLLGGGGGPATTSNSGLTLTGSLGQPVTGVANGGETVLHGGFWHSGSTQVYRSYLPSMYENK